MALRLEVFDDPHTPPPAAPQAVDEEGRIAAYESGYSAGWDDAVAAQSDEQGRIRADLGRNLQSLSFTYEEARQNLLRAVLPPLTDATAALLPVVARAALAPHVAAHWRALADSLADVPVTLLVHPEQFDLVQAVLADAPRLPFALRGEPSLGDGQALLRWGDGGTRVDLDAAAQQIRALLDAHFHLIERPQSHG